MVRATVDLVAPVSLTGFKLSAAALAPKAKAAPSRPGLGETLDRTARPQAVTEPVDRKAMLARMRALTAELSAVPSKRADERALAMRDRTLTEGLGVAVDDPGLMTTLRRAVV